MTAGLSSRQLFASPLEYEWTLRLSVQIHELPHPARTILCFQLSVSATVH